jgi:hypothetical protein
MSHYHSTPNLNHDPEKAVAAIYPRSLVALASHSYPQFPPLNFHDGDEQSSSLDTLSSARSHCSITHPKPALVRHRSPADQRIQSPTGGEIPKSPPPKRGTKEASGPPAKAKTKVSRWILFQLWYNTYRYVLCIYKALS